MGIEEIMEELGESTKVVALKNNWVLGMEAVNFEPLVDDSHIDFIAYDSETEAPIDHGRLVALYPSKGLVLYADVNPALGFELNSLGEIIVEDWDGKILNNY